MLIEAIPLRSFEYQGRIVAAGSKPIPLPREKFEQMKTRGLVARVPGQRWLEVVCIASGPSLTLEQVELVRQWREAGEGRGVIVCNTSYRAALWADVLFFIDEPWWTRFHKDEVRATFKGEVISPAAVKGVTHLPSNVMNPRGNTGAGAICLAEFYVARRIILIGYDCHTRGGTHWHGNHPKGLGNCGSIRHWPAIFAGVARDVRAEIINCTPGTALTCFRKGDLREALELPLEQTLGVTDEANPEADDRAPRRARRSRKAE